MDTKQNVISKEFVTEVAKYFMAFLETDFKKRSQPKRNLTTRVNKGVSTGLYLDKYESLYRELYKNFIGGFSKETIEIKLGQHTTKISDRLVSLLEQRIDQLSEDEVKSVVAEISKEINQLRLDNQKDYDNYFETSIEVIRAKFASTIVAKLLNDIEKSLEAAGWSAESGLFQLETDATARIYALAEDSIANILEEFFAEANKDYVLSNALNSLFDIETVRSALKEFFRDFSAKDAYADILQLNRNKDMLDKTELYAYFGEIGIDNNSFPLFYTPISVEQEDSKISMTFENRVFVNIKAIEFVVQQNNTSTSSTESVAGNFERIIYFEDKKGLLPALQKTIDSCRDALGLTKPVELKQPTQQIANNMVARVSNRLQLFLFDKSDESLINDYEEIIDNQSELTEAFAELIESFVTEQPANVIEDVALEWEEKTIQDKLIVDSPIALNEEQKQVLLALQKPDCKVAILEGPPGTGKSHTITAIVCKALLEGQSVLVLSDKEEALDVVQDKISTTLSTIRHDKDFQNPILRLGKSSSGLAKVIEGHSLERVREHMRAYRSRQSEFENEETVVKESAKAELEYTISTGEKLNLDAIRETLLAQEKYGDITWLDNVNIVPQAPEDSDGDPIESADQVMELINPSTGALFTREEAYHWWISNTDIRKREAEDKLTDALKNVHASVSSVVSSKVLHLLPLVSHDYQEVEKLPDIIEAASDYQRTKSHIDKDNKNFVSGYESLNAHDQKRLTEQLDKLCEDFDNDVLTTYLSATNYINDAVKNKDFHSTFKDYASVSNEYNRVRDTAAALSMFAPNIHDFEELIEVSLKHDVGINELYTNFSEFVLSIQSLKSRILGFSGKKQAIAQLVRNFKTKLPYFNISSPEKRLVEFIGFSDTLNFLKGKLEQQELGDKQWMYVLEQIQLQKDISDKTGDVLGSIAAPAEFDFMLEYSIGQLHELRLVIDACDNTQTLKNLLQENERLLQTLDLDPESILLKPDEAIKKLEAASMDVDELHEIVDHMTVIKNFIAEHPDAAENLNISLGMEGLESIDDRFVEMEAQELNEYIDTIKSYELFEDAFKTLAADSFSSSSEKLHQLNAAKMANVLDTKIIDYVDHHANDLRTLKSMLKSKQKFPKELFGDLKQAFPCILAGIRDYATYIPLEKGLFDLVIIDEASQVSIAQALPALIRGRKILVLGDEKQFSNVKAGNASVLTNTQYKSNILKSLKASIDAERKGSSSVYITRVEDNFNIKRSILEFCRFITNYQTMLKKHFRGYPEIIGYSNKYFYEGRLQSMKARALPIGEVLKFTQVDTGGVQGQYRLTNTTEADFILEQFMSLKSKDYEGSIGVITPHREQATYINNLLNESGISDWLHEHHLKVMTFDTCQGEERDYIIYSMVASPEEDKHWTIFPVSMVESRKVGKELGTREQRLNVGFSRAKETMHFVLSKPVGEYWGEVKTALLHYENVLNTTTYELGGTDKKSPMEPLVQNYFYQTEFYEKNKENVELVPQFPLGDYLKSLDRNYSHPSYKVDFLLTFGKQKIVIEYDGFKEHFIDRDEVNETNYENYLNASDIYRQKVLEGYGYKFLRLNKFNLGKEPVKELDGLLANIVKKKTRQQGQLIHS